MSKRWLEVDEGEWRTVFDVNVRALFYTSAAFLPLLRAGIDKFGAWDSSILIISSISGITKTTQRGQYIYNSSKAAAISLSNMLATELLRPSLQIRTNNLAPVRKSLTDIACVHRVITRASLRLATMILRRISRRQLQKSSSRSGASRAVVSATGSTSPRPLSSSRAAAISTARLSLWMDQCCSQFLDVRPPPRACADRAVATGTTRVSLTVLRLVFFACSLHVCIVQ